MTAFEKEGKISSLKQNSRRKRMLSDRDRRILVGKDHKNTAPKITAELNNHLENPLSSKSVRKLHKDGFHGRGAIRKPLFSQTNITMRLECSWNFFWSLEKLKNVIFWDETSFFLFPISGRIYVWRQPKETFDPDCLLPTVKHREGSLMIFISWKSDDPMVSLHDRIKRQDYFRILSDQIHLMADEVFPEENTIFQDDNALIPSAKIVS